MKTMTVGQLKTHFSSVLEEIQNGQSIIIAYGQQKKKVGMITPYPNPKKKRQRRIGILEGKASCSFAKDFKMTDEEFLTS